MRVYVPTREHCTLVTEDQSLIANFLRYNDDDKDVEFVDSAEQSDLIIIFEHWSFKLWDHKDTLRDCSLLRGFIEKVFTINYDDHGRGYLPGCYTSLTTRNFDPHLHRACSYPKTYNQFADQTGRESIAATRSSSLLFSFCGTSDSHPVRRAILRELSGCEAGKIEYVDQTFHQHTDAQKLKFAQQILDSSFVLCPRGWSPTTYRLFEVMALGRCPVIISDEWVSIDGIEWEECSVRIDESDIPRIPDILSRRSADAETLGANARRVWEQFFSLERRNKYYLDSIRDLYKRSREKAPASFDELYSRWSSWRFYWSNGWTIPQRARFKFDKAIRSVSGR